MKNISDSNSNIAITQFKSDLTKHLNEVQKNKNCINVTKYGKRVGVLISYEEYQMLKGSNLFVKSVLRGLRDIENGDTYTTEQLRIKLKNRSY